MRVLVTGSRGQLGYQTLKTLSRDIEVIPTSKKRGEFGDFSFVEMSITDYGKVDLIIEEKEPEIVVNCAAYTNVDACELNPNIARRVNSDAVENLAKTCKVRGIKLIQISTDYVFDGRGPPYEEYSDKNPIQEYGKSKSSAEEIIQSETGLDWAIVRASGIFSTSHNNFLTWLLKSANENKEVFIVGDQYSTPISALSVSRFISKIIDDNLSGIWNIGSTETVSRLDFARKVCQKFEVGLENISESRMSSIPWKAERPVNTSLDTIKMRSIFPGQSIDSMIEELVSENSEKSLK